MKIIYLEGCLSYFLRIFTEDWKFYKGVYGTVKLQLKINIHLVVLVHFYVMIAEYFGCVVLCVEPNGSCSHEVFTNAGSRKNRHKQQPYLYIGRLTYEILKIRIIPDCSVIILTEHQKSEV